MNKILVLLIFFSFSFSYSQDWKLINKTEEGEETYIRTNTRDTAWIKRTNMQVPISLESNKTTDGQILTLYKFDCRSKKSGTLAIYIYNNDGEVLDSWEEINDVMVKMKYVIPDSVGEFYLKSFCELD